MRATRIDGLTDALVRTKRRVSRCVVLFAIADAVALVGSSCGNEQAPKTSPMSEATSSGPGVPTFAASSSQNSSHVSSETITASVSTTATTQPGSASTAVDPSDNSGADVVRGRVIDFWGHPLPNVAVGIGDERTQTNEHGEFVFTGVAQVYDVSLVVRLAGEVVEVYGWRYEGLTRRDPTLQVYKGLRQREARVTFDVTGIMPESVHAEAAMGGIDGHRAYAVSSVSESLAAWRGEESVTASVHALSWKKPDGARIPITYLAHTTNRVTLSEDQSIAIQLDLTSAAELQVDNIFGRVGSSREVDRVHLTFARFDDGPSLLLVSEPRSATSEAAFVYPAPQLDAASFTVAVRADTKLGLGDYAVGYVSDVTPGQDVGMIELPVPAQLQEPLDGASDVTRETVCSWDVEGGTSVVVFDDLLVFQAVYVVTSNKYATLPDLSNLGLFYNNQGLYTWAVEVHGTAKTTDELSGEDGFLDPFSGDLSYPMGRRSGQGRFARSASRTFTTGKVNDSPFAR